jgi:cytochrome oxidase assembly protein ShyY1
MGLSDTSQFRVEKQRSDAVITLTSGTAVIGHFFLAEASPVLPGRERVAELLNSEPGFFPFEQEGGHTILYNRGHVVTVEVSEDEARRDSGYGVATRRTVSVLLSNGQRLQGSIRVYRPEGQDRLSDWARHGQRFRYLETAQATFIVNVDHIVDAREVT